MELQSAAVDDVINQLCPPPPQTEEEKSCCFMCMRTIEKDEKSNSLPVTERLNKSFDSILHYLTGTSHRHHSHHDTVNGKSGLDANNWRNGKCKNGDDSSDHSSNQIEDGSDYLSKLKQQVPPFCIGCYDILGNIFDLHQSLVKTQREIEQQTCIARSVIKRSFHTEQDYYKGGGSGYNLVYKLREEVTKNAKNQVLFPSQLPPTEEEGSNSTGTIPSPMSPLPLLVNLVEDDSRDNGQMSVENEHQLYHHRQDLQSPSTSSAAAAAAMSNVPMILRMPDGQALAMIPSSMISSQQGQQAVVVEMEDEKISNVQVVGDFSQQQGIGMGQRLNGKQMLMMMKPGIPCTEGTPYMDPRSGQLAYLQFPPSSESPGFQQSYFSQSHNEEIGGAVAGGNVHLAHHSLGSTSHDLSSVQPMLLNMSPPYTRHVPPSLESILNKLGIPPPIEENQSLDASVNPTLASLQQRSSEGVSTPTTSDTPDDMLPPPGPASTCSSSEWPMATSHPCDVCSAEIPKQSIYPHLISHVGAEYVFHCEFCQVSFLTPFRLKAYHEGRMKTDKCPAYDPETYLVDYLQCEQCSFKADSIFMLKTHLSSHENEKTAEEKTVKCPMCTVKYSMKGSTLLHLQDCHIYNKTKRRSEICEQCKKSLPLHDMESHMRSTHNIHTVRMLRCKFCPAVFTSLKGIIEHQKQAGKHNVHPISCHLCDTKFDLATYLRDHYYKEHNLRERYRCQRCLKDFHALKIYESHKTTCTGGNGANLKKKNGSTLKSKLKANGASSSSSVSLKCNDCGKRFLREHIYKKHIASAHQPGSRGGMKQSKRYTFVCEKCGEAFEMQALLNYHARMEHSKDERTPPTPRSTECIRKMETVVEAPIAQLDSTSTCIENPDCGSVEVVQENIEETECGDGEDTGNGSDSQAPVSSPVPVSVDAELSSGESSSKIVQTNDNNNAERPYKCRLCGQGFNHLSNRFTHEKSHKMLGNKFKPAGPRQ